MRYFRHANRPPDSGHTERRSETPPIAAGDRAWETAPRRIVDYLEREREQFKADLLRFGKQLNVAKASADLIKVMDALKSWVKGWTKF